MTGNLDKSLDSILAERKQVARRGGRNRRTATGKPITAPVGGVKKSTKPAPKSNKSGIPTGPSNKGGVSKDAKIMVHNLPNDVDEKMVKEYFQSTIGSVKRVEVNYLPNGKSRGSAYVVFHNQNSAIEAVKKTDGVKVLEKPLKVELVLDASMAPEPKKLADLITQPKKAAKGKNGANPKSAAEPKKATTGRNAKGKGTAARGGRGGKRAPGRGKKTAEELDAEMTDYFGTGTAEASNGGTAPQAADTNMDGEI